MFLKKSRILTGLITITMTASMMGAPVYAMGGSARMDASANLNPVTGNVITPENAQAELIADAVMPVFGRGQKIDSEANKERKAVIESASEKTTLQQEGKTEFAVAAPNVYLNIHTDASLGSEVIGKLYSNDVTAATGSRSSRERSSDMFSANISSRAMKRSFCQSWSRKMWQLPTIATMK